MTETVKCPKCGQEVDKRGLKSHKYSRNCKATRKRKEYKEKGMLPVNDRFLVNRLKERDVEIKYGISGHREGAKGRAGSYKRSHYIDKDTLKQVKNSYLVNKRIAHKYRKIAETSGYLLLKKGAGKDSELILCKKDEEGKTRRRKFWYKTFIDDDNSVYNLDREKAGETVSVEDAEGEIVNIYTAEAL